MMPTLAESLTNHIIFENRESGEFFAIENALWDKEYRYNEKRLKNDESFEIEVEQLVLDPFKNKYISSGQKSQIKYLNLKAVLVEKKY